MEIGYAMLSSEMGRFLQILWTKAALACFTFPEHINDPRECSCCTLFKNTYGLYQEAYPGNYMNEEIGWHQKISYVKASQHSFTG